MILTDTGALIALLDKDDPSHAICVNAAKYLPAAPLLTTWSCFTEAMYLLGEVVDIVISLNSGRCKQHSNSFCMT